MGFVEKYQATIDKINERIPIKWFTGPIDKLFPTASLFLFILVIILVLLLIINPFSGGVGTASEETGVYTIAIADSNSRLLPNFEFHIKNLGTDTTQTYRTDSKGMFVIELNSRGDYSLIINQKGYKYKEELLDLSKQRLNFVVDIFETKTTQSKALQFVAPGGQLVSEKLNVTITCQDGSQTVVQPTTVVENGTATFELPLACDMLVATAMGGNYSATNVQINQETGLVQLQEREKITDYGQARVIVKSGENPLDGITLRVYTIEDTVNPVVAGQSQFGVKRFPNLEVGGYIVTATDDSGRYQTKTKDFIVSKNVETQVNLELDAINTVVNPGDTVVSVVTRDIKVILKDNETSQELTTTVTPTVLLIMDGNITVDSKGYQEAGIMFRVEQGKSYQLTAKAEGYIPNTRTITPNANEYVIYLEKITVSNVSNINVSAKDEDGLAVANATLWLYDGNSGFIDTRFTPINTDANGEAVFTTIPVGYYFVKLRKAVVLEESQKFSHAPPTDSNVSMQVNIGQGTLNFTIKNSNSEAIAFADITLYDITGEEIGLDQANQFGVYNKRIKADKIVYAKVSKDSYMDYYTEFLPILKNETVNKEIILYRSGYATVPKVELTGLYGSAKQPVTYLTQNARHYFRFRLITPDQRNLGLRFLIGEENDVADDIVYIKQIENSKANTFYYSDITPTRVIEDTPAKMVDVIFPNANAGVYELEIPVQTLTARRGDAVPIYYSIYTALAPEPNYLSDQNIYYIDVSELCSDNFCLKGQFVDLEDDIVYDLENTGNGLIINKNYLFEYEITNAKSNVFLNNRLSIRNIENDSEIPTQALNFLSYTLSGAGFSQESSTTAGDSIKNGIPFYEDYLDSQAINVYDKIEISANLKPMLLGGTRLQNKIISGQSVIYDKAIDIAVSQQYEFTISYEPQNIVPNKQFVLTVTAIDESNLPVSNAIVNVYQKKGNNQLIALNIGQQRTNDLGVATLNMPALKNTEKIVISVERCGYYAEPVEIIISQDILKLKQEGKEITAENPFILNINKSNPQGTEKTLTIVNRTDYPLTLREFTDDGFSFSNSEYLNIRGLKEFMNLQVPSITVPANGEASIRLKLSASQDAEDLTETLNIVGTINGNVSVDNGVSNYPFQIPMNIKLSVGEGVEEDDCLVVGTISNPWQTIVSGNGVVTQTLDIYNNCMMKGNFEQQPITLKNIRAKIVNEKDRYGQYILTVDGKPITLSEGVYTTIFNEVAPGRHSGIIEFRALDKKFGDVKSKIYINGQVETDNGLKYVNTTKEIAFTTDISIRRIEDCFDFYDGSKKINNIFVIPKETTTYQPQELIVKNNCSDLGRFRLEFCEDKKWSACQELDYDNMEGSFQNELNFERGDDSETVGIKKPETPGGYIIPVKISILGDSGRAITSIEKRLKLNVHSSTGLYMEDPFIELEKAKTDTGKEIYTSQPVRLLNSDINKTPWDYAQRKVPGDKGFSRFMAEFKAGASTYEKMLFNQIDKLQNIKEEGASGLAQAGYYTGGAGSAIAAIALTLSVAGVGGLSFLVPLAAFLGPVGIGFIAILSVVAFVAPLFYSDYTYDPVYLILDVDPIYTNIDYVIPKTINLLPEESQTELVNVFDITGARYITYIKGYGDGHGKLASDKTLTMTMPNCNGDGHREQFKTYEYISNSKNCDGYFSEIKNEGDKTSYSVKCNGAIPRKKIKLETHAYSFCKLDTDYWPEQAGIKPLNFIAEKDMNTDSIYNRLERGDIVYKTISFKPTLDDTNHEQDKAFTGSEPIGDFRFVFLSKQYPETPEGDQELVDCFTDSGKAGRTGDIAVPKVKFDWTWQFNGFDLNKCSTGEQYCDATQLSQVIVERMKSFEEQLQSKQISCPLSTAQIVDNALSGRYSFTSSVPALENEVPIGYVGLNNVSVNIDGNLIRLKIVIENRTSTAKTGQLNVKFGDVPLQSYTELLPISLISDECVSPRQYISGDMTGINPLNPTLSINVPTCESENTAELIFTYGNENNPMVGNNIKLEVSYVGEGAYLPDPTYTYYTTDFNFSVYEAQVADDACYVPATTAKVNGVDYIDMWFNGEQYPEYVISEWNNEDIQQLKQTIEFDAYLITDNYNKQFQLDFDKAYGGKMSAGQSGTYAFMGAPGYYQTGIFSELFRDKTQFYLNYANSQSGVNILVPGKYTVRIDFVFGNDSWKFTNESGDVDVNAFVTFTYRTGPETDSIFYRMPFDGAVGLTNSGYSRQNYGVAYLGDDIIISNQGVLPLTTGYSSSSNPKKYINVQYNKDFFKANSAIETRGNILTIKETSDDQIELSYSPSYPTKVLMTVERNILLPFTAYYQLQDASNQPVFGGSSLGVWNGVGDLNYYDFSGEHVSSRFINFYDRQASPDEHIYNSYAIDWDSVARKGVVNLRTIFYTPYDNQNRAQQYKLISKSRGDTKVKFIDNVNYSKSYYEKAIPGESTEEYKIQAISDIFQKVKGKQVCVVNSDGGKVTEFYWNPKEIYGQNNMYSGVGIIGIN